MSSESASAIRVTIKSIEASDLGMSEIGMNNAFVKLSLGGVWQLLTTVKENAAISSTWSISTGGTFALTKDYADRNAMILSLKNHGETSDVDLGTTGFYLSEQFSRIVYDEVEDVPTTIDPQTGKPKKTLVPRQITLPSVEEVMIPLRLMSPDKVKTTGTVKLTLYVTRNVVAPAAGFDGNVTEAAASTTVTTVDPVPSAEPTYTVTVKSIVATNLKPVEIELGADGKPTMNDGMVKLQIGSVWSMLTDVQ